MAPPRPPLDRNVTIAYNGDELFAAPKGMAEELRSGTWHCVRSARKINRPVTIAWPRDSALRGLVARLTRDEKDPA